MSRDVGHWHVFSEATCSLEGLRAPRRAETRGRAPGEGSRCMGGRGIRVPFDGQRRAGGMGEPPGGEPRRWPLASFSEATCSLEGSRAPRRAETGPSARGGHSLHGGRGVRVPFDGQRRAGGMGEPPGASRDVGHWHVFPRQHARSRGRAETGRDGAECAGRALVAWGGGRVRMGGMGRVRGAACTGHGVTAVACEGSPRCRGRALFALACRGLEGGICGGAMPRMAWAACTPRAARAAACLGGWCCQPIEDSTPPLKSILGHFGNALRRHHPCLRRHNAIF